MKRYIHTVNRLFNTTLLLHPDYARDLWNVMLGRLGMPLLEGHTPFSIEVDDEPFGPDEEGSEEDESPYARAPFRGFANWYKLREFENIGILPIKGAMTNDGPAGFASLGQSYKSIQDDFIAMNRDDSVDGNLIVVSTPGGEVTGVKQTLEVMLANKSKPTWLLINESMYSGGVFLGGAADTRFAVESSGAGSIGVIFNFMEYSKQLEARGVTQEFIKSGEKKDYGNSYQPLSDEARADLQAQSDAIYEMFTKAVGDNYPNMTQEQAKATEAGVFYGSELIQIGLAEETVSDETTLLQMFSEHLSGQSVDRTVSTPSKAAVAAAQDTTEGNDVSVKEKNQALFVEVMSSEAALNNPRVALQYLEMEGMEALPAETLVKLISDASVVAAPAPAETDESDTEEMQALLLAAQKGSGTPKVTGRGEGSGSDSDGTGDVKRALHGTTNTSKSALYVPEGFGVDRTDMHTGFMNTAKKFAQSRRKAV